MAGVLHPEKYLPNRVGRRMQYDFRDSGDLAKALETLWANIVNAPTHSKKLRDPWRGD